MCGICGVVWTTPEHAPGDATLDRMVERIRHRGPDDAGTYRDAHAALGFRRLAILDLAGAHQPLANEDRTVWVVFNGEIYNYQALRHRLEAQGHQLRTQGDTEVLVHLYEEHGTGMFALLRGMFALAIWDAPRKRLVLGRDRLGQKPLVYHRAGQWLAFASELKALAALPARALPLEIDPLALDHYLALGYIPHPRTIYRGVHKLPPAHFAVWEEGHFTLQRYWEPDWQREAIPEAASPAETLRTLLDEAVAEQMVADVPVGAFLSGGIDSTIIAGLMQRHATHRVQTFSIGFDDPAFDESSYAALAAKHLGTEHHAFIVQPRAWETLPALVRQFDEPFADSSALPTWHVSQITRQEVTVALTGDAGDELFGGYDRYRAMALAGLTDRLPAAARTWLGGPLARALPASARAKTPLRKVRRLLEGIGTPADCRYLTWMRTFDESARLDLYSPGFLEHLGESARHLADAGAADPDATLLRCLELAPGRDPATRAMICDLLTYLPGDLLHKVDMASMAHSLECRGPFLDHRVVEFALGLPIAAKIHQGRTKAVLKDAFADLLPRPIRHRAKMGFGVPLDRWFRGELAGELRAVLLDPSTLGRGYFQPEAVARLVEEHLSSRADHAYRLWALLILELWHREHADLRGRDSA